MEGDGSYLDVDPDAESESDNSSDDSDDGSAPPTERVDFPPKPKTLNPTYVSQTASPERVARGRANSGMPTDELEPRMRERVNTGLGGDEVLARLSESIREFDLDRDPSQPPHANPLRRPDYVPAADTLEPSPVRLRCSQPWATC